MAARRGGGGVVCYERARMRPHQQPPLPSGRFPSSSMALERGTDAQDLLFQIFLGGAIAIQYLLSFLILTT